MVRGRGLISGGERNRGLILVIDMFTEEDFDEAVLMPVLKRKSKKHSVVKVKPGIIEADSEIMKEIDDDGSSSNKNGSNQNGGNKKDGNSGKKVVIEYAASIRDCRTKSTKKVRDKKIGYYMVGADRDYSVKANEYLKTKVDDV